MIPSTKRATDHRAQSKRPAGASKGARLTLESLEERITPAARLAPPALLDPAAAIRVDQASYSIRGTLAEAAKKGTTVYAYRDSN
jgi:hypothetical protein